MSEQVRFGIVGTGGIVRQHMRRFREVPEAQVAALTDPDPDRIAALKENFPEAVDCPSYPDHRRMIEEEELDAISIASPHNVHASQTIDALRAGLHVLTEKPMVCTIEDAHRVMEQEEKADRMVGIAYQRHTQGEFRFVKGCIESGDPGPVQYVTAFQGQNWLQGTTGTWRQDKEISCGGQLNDSGSHLIDIILWVTGLKAERVSASIQNFGREVDINSAVNIEFADGALGTLSVVGNCPRWWEDITIVCSEWAFFLRRGSLTYVTGSRGETLSLEGTGYRSTSPNQNFVSAILGREELLAPSVCGLRTIELTEAAWKSAEKGEPVSL